MLIFTEVWTKDVFFSKWFKKHNLCKLLTFLNICGQKTIFKSDLSGRGFSWNVDLKKVLYLDMLIFTEKSMGYQNYVKKCGVRRFFNIFGYMGTKWEWSKKMSFFSKCWYFWIYGQKTILKSDINIKIFYSKYWYLRI